MTFGTEEVAGCLRLTSLEYLGAFETADTEAARGRGDCRSQATCAESGPRVRRHGRRGSLVSSALALYKERSLLPCLGLPCDESVPLITALVGKAPTLSLHPRVHPGQPAQPKPKGGSGCPE